MAERNPHLFWGLVAIAVALVICSMIGARAVHDAKRSGDEISVTGSARKPVTSDLIIWSGSVGAQSDSLTGAYQTVQQYTERVKAYLKDQKVPDTAVTYPPVTTETIMEMREDGRETGKILGYKLTQAFTINSNDVNGITSLSRRITSLIKEGIPLASQPPEYLVTKLADLRLEMLDEATKDAKLRAEKIAKSAGSKIGPVRGARMGVFQITPRYSTDVSGAGINDTSSLEKDITAVVSITFAVE